MGDKNPKHPLKKKKEMPKTNVAAQRVADNDGDLSTKSKKHAN